MVEKAFKKIQFEDYETSQFQQNVESALNPILSKPLIDHTIIKSVFVSSSADTNVNHGLQKLVSVIPINLNANAVVWQKQSLNPTPTVSVLLRASADVTCDLILF